eukprot:Transcript_9970.p2 GENE.Transcript_9970~~Transcript_9970.p2  ORF type:complete len:457 (-),score=156.64 Transcript_9970:30-1400(-)
MVPPFYLYEGDALDFSWMRELCPGFGELRRQAYNERLGEVAMTDLLKTAPQRTRRPEEASLFFVPVWEFTSFSLGPCNGTTHRQRMARAAAALQASPHFRAGAWPGAAFGRAADRRPGFDHAVLTTACIEGNHRAAERYGPLSSLLKHAIVGRDRAYNSFYAGSAVGRCTIETPYVSNPSALVAAASRAPPSSPDASSEASASASASASAGGGARGEQQQAMLRRVERDKGWRARRAQRGGTDFAFREADYAAYGAEMARADFCLVPAGDSEVSSRLYSAIAALCIPVVIANQLSGAFASYVPYDRLWLRVEQDAFVRQPLELLPRLRAVPLAARARMRRALLAHRADVVYAAARSRVAAHFLRAAYHGCVAPRPTRRLGAFPPGHKYGDAEDRWKTGCSCVATPPRYWWADPRRPPRWHKGNWPTELCRCLHCSVLCPEVNATLAYQRREFLGTP